MLLSILSRQSYAKYGIKIPKSTWCHNWKARAVAVQFPAKQFLERKRGFSLVLSRSPSCYNSSGRENGPNWALLLLLYRLSSISLRDTQLFVCTTIFILTCNQRHSGIQNSKITQKSNSFKEKFLTDLPTWRYYKNTYIIHKCLHGKWMNTYHCGC